MSHPNVQIDQAKIRAITALLTGSEAGRAVLDGLTEERLGRLDTKFGVIVDAINAAREEVRSLKDDWRSRGAGHRAEMAELAAKVSEADDTLLEASRRLRLMTLGLREGGIDERICTLIDQQVTHVLIASESFEFSTDQLGRMAGMLGALEGSVSRLAGAKPPAPKSSAHRHAG